MKGNQMSFPFLAILSLIFITLKLTGTLDWSWWWILAPLWIPIVLALVIILAVVLLARSVTGKWPQP